MKGWMLSMSGDGGLGSPASYHCSCWAELCWAWAVCPQCYIASLQWDEAQTAKGKWWLGPRAWGGERRGEHDAAQQGPGTRGRESIGGPRNGWLVLGLLSPSLAEQGAPRGRGAPLAEDCDALDSLPDIGWNGELYHVLLIDKCALESALGEFLGASGQMPPRVSDKESWWLCACNCCFHVANVYEKRGVEEWEGKKADYQDGHGFLGLVRTLKTNVCDISWQIIIAWSHSSDPLVGDPGPEARVVSLVRDNLDAAVWELDLVFPLGQLARRVLHVPVVVTCVKCKWAAQEKTEALANVVRSISKSYEFPHMCRLRGYAHSIWLGWYFGTFALKMGQKGLKMGLKCLSFVGYSLAWL